VTLSDDSAFLKALARSTRLPMNDKVKGRGDGALAPP
jgi:hypothetical protein